MKSGIAHDRPTGSLFGLLGVIAIVALVVLAYGRTFSAPFVFDDIPAIVGNDSIRHLMSAWSPPPNTTASGRPVLNETLALNFALGGTSVAGYHLANLAIHLLAGCVLFALARRTLEGRQVDKAAQISAIAAALWLAHPLQTESVTYVIQRAESLMGLLYLLTLYALVRSCSASGLRSRLGWQAAAVASCALGMGSKEVMVSAPVIALLYDRTFLSGSFRDSWRQRKGLYLALAATWAVLIPLVIGTHGRSGTSGAASGVSWWPYVETQFGAVVLYLRLAVWPSPLDFDYGTRWIGDPSALLLPAALIACLAALSFWATFSANPSRRPLGFCGLWFFAVLAPTSLVAGNRQTAAEHRMYLALAPLAVIAAWLAIRWARRAALGLSAAAIVALAAVTWNRNGVYQSPLRLWTDTVAKSPANAQAQDNLGNALAETPGGMPQAITHFQEAVRLDPFLAHAHNNLGNAWAQAPGHREDAINEYKRALAITPDLPETHNNLANLLNQEGRMQEAIQEYELALRLQPGYAAAHINLAITLLNLPGHEAEATSHLETALRIDPTQALPREILASLHSGGS